jgi:hypothetical protein
MEPINEQEKIQTTIAALRRRGFDARFAENREAARKIVLDLVPQDWIVGCGDSATIRSLGVFEELADLGKPFLPAKDHERETAANATTSVQADRHGVRCVPGQLERRY